MEIQIYIPFEYFVGRGMDIHKKHDMKSNNCRDNYIKRNNMGTSLFGKVLNWKDTDEKKDLLNKNSIAFTGCKVIDRDWKNGHTETL